MSIGIRPVLGGVALMVAATLMTPATAWAGPRHTTPNGAVSLADKLDPVSNGHRHAAKVAGTKVTVGDVAVTVQAKGDAKDVDGSTVINAATTDFVVRGLDDGTQILAVADDSSSLTQRYTFTGRYLELRPDGAVIVRKTDATSEPLAYIDPAWAKDALGTPQTSRYSVDGDTLTQTTTPTTKTSYPVVADPRLRNAWYGWSVDFSRYETSQMSKSTSACSAIAGLVAISGVSFPLAGAIAGAISAYCGALTVFADKAVENEKCVSVKVLFTYVVVPWMPKCYK